MLPLIASSAIGVLIAFFAWITWVTWPRSGDQLPLQLPCVRCNGGPQGDLDCYLCGGMGYISRATLRRGW